MLHDVDNMEASCVFYVDVGTINHIEQSTISLLTVNEMGIVRQIVHHEMISKVSFMEYPGGLLRQTSAYILSLKV